MRRRGLINYDHNSTNSLEFACENWGISSGLALLCSKIEGVVLVPIDQERTFKSMLISDSHRLLPRSEARPCDDARSV
jgi:hypothetical protein